MSCFRYRSGIQSLGSMVSPRAIRASNSATAENRCQWERVSWAERYILRPCPHPSKPVPSPPRSATESRPSGSFIPRGLAPRRPAFPARRGGQRPRQAPRRAGHQVLRSEGTGPFCAGASFQELQAISTIAQGKQFFSGFAKLIIAMTRCPRFIIARVHGKAVGGGVGSAQRRTTPTPCRRPR